MNLLQKINNLLDFSLTEQEIREKAHALWLADGSPNGDGKSYWVEAEKTLLELKRKKVAEDIVKKTVSPLMQNATADMQDQIDLYSKEAMKILQEEALGQKQYILPEGTKYHKVIGSNHYLVIEQAPSVRTILVDRGYHRDHIGSHRNAYNSDHRHYRIALPYTLYFLVVQECSEQQFLPNISSFRIAYRQKPLKSLDEQLLLSILPNSQSDTYAGMVCCPFPGIAANSLVEAVDHMIGFYWQAEFRYCLHLDFPRHPSFRTWEAWESATKENPLFVLDKNIQWPTMNPTMKSFLSVYGTGAGAGATPSSKFQEASSKFVRAAAKILSLEKELTAK